MSDTRYTKDHDWVTLQGDIATLGITDFAQDALGDVVFLELPRTGDQVTSGDSVGVIESIKSVVDLYAPFDGEIIAVNEEAVNNPALCNRAPLTTWLFKVRLNDLTFWDLLMKPEDYQKFCNR